ncbi:MAG: MBL fold metallo-hydrolase [Deltaproteobacteria bacterium GWC2_56_8]|nr:MAG: MBL fold metallo-hydrolase [Deltaproteobacteria bacterium GWC2_56_8]
MKIIILGCGTSTGVPVIGCHCPTCSSSNPRNKRTRSSILVQEEGRNIPIDTSTDLRAQALGNGIERIDAVLFTHPHADHIHGIDDLRAFNLAQKGPIPCYGSALTIERIRVMFDYIFREDAGDGWKPNLTTNIVDGPVMVFGIGVEPIDISHGSAAIFGYRIGRLAYLTDCSGIPPASIEKLKGVELLILGALRHKPHPTHFSVEQAMEASRAIGPERTILTHLGHNLDYEKDASLLPPGIELAYDGLTIEL